VSDFHKVAATVFAAAAFLYALFWTSPARSYPAQIYAVLDGDTVETVDHQRIRIAHIDAPEKPSNRWPAQPGWLDAKSYLASLTYGQTVDVQVAQDDPSYGRVVADLILPNGVSVAASMISAGYAWVEPRYCKPCCEQLENLQLQARMNGRGIWPTGGHVPPWQWRKSSSSK
jgi:endonuclease YncB( thermonuclease family)